MRTAHAQLPVPFTFEMEQEAGVSVRSPEVEGNVHVSTIRDYTAVKLKINNYSVDFESQGLKMSAYLGIAFEERIVQDFDWIEPHPPEVSHGGVVGSPDGRMLPDYEVPDRFADYRDVLAPPDWLLDTDYLFAEIKCSKTSTRHAKAGVEEAVHGGEALWWQWAFQLKSYCAIAAANGDKVRGGQVISCGINGDYGDSRDVELHANWFGWSGKELEQHMGLLERTAPKALEWKRQGGVKGA